MKKKIRRWAIDILVMIFASAIYSLGIHIFISPNDIAPGGVTGIAIILTNFWGISVGTLISLLNIPLIIAGFILLNKTTMIKTMISVALITVFTNLAEMFVPVYDASGGNGVVAAIFGGAAMGIGLGLGYNRESTSGGTDILTKIIGKYHTDFKLGAIQAVLDGIVVVMGFVVYRNVNTVLFAVIAIFVQSKLTDTIVYGSQESRFMLIFSENYKMIAEEILKQSNGVTLFKGEGAYSGSERQVLATAVHRSNYSKVKRIVKTADPKAFVITTSANEVYGEGFTKLN
ncbi:MAG: YitT family protein [Oscillospiraceae bacterium]|nr:YitT family protein [Oscillospiraceae bacterium]